MSGATPTPQKTLAGPVQLEGIGLHCGETVTMRIEPGEPSTGVVFVRSDAEGVEIPADRHHVVPCNRGTRIKNGEVEVQTVEHLLASLYAAGIDNARVVLDAPEPPAMDGSAELFVKAIDEVGVVEQDGPRPGYRVLFPVSFAEGGATITALPSPEFRITSAIEYPDTAIGVQSHTMTVTPEAFRDQLMRARTFCLKSEVDAMQSAGLALGGSLDNAVVVDGHTVMNDGLRFPDEFVRHKMLDLVGDLAIAGAPIQGHFVAHKTGHVHNVKLLQAMFAQGALASMGGAPSVPMNVQAICRILPHRYPFLLVDSIEELEVGQRAVGLKAVTINEPFFQGHFPGNPIMPGVLIMEALAQVAGVTMLSKPEFQGKTPFFTGLDKVVFRQPIRPGDVIRLEIEIEKIKLSMGRAQGVARVGEKVAASGVLKFTLIE